MIDNRLISLLNIVEYGSYTKAAEQLSLTQPAVTQHIKQIEKMYNVKVFKRKGNRVVLTKEGEIITNYARRIVRLTEQLETSLQNEHEKKYNFSVGIAPNIESSSVVGTLINYASASPELNLKLISGEISRLSESLSRFELDFAIMEGKIDDPMFINVPIQKDRLVLAVSSKHPLAKQKEITLKQLTKEKLITRHKTAPAWTRFREQIEKAGYKDTDFTVTMETDNLAAIKELVIQNIGVSVIAKSSCENEIKRGRIVALNIENVDVTREISLVYPKDFEYPEILQGIIKEFEHKN